MSGLEDRIRKLERQMARLDAPPYDAFREAHNRLIARMHKCMCEYWGFEGVYSESDQRLLEGDTPERARHDEDIIRRWNMSQGITTEMIAIEAEVARQKLEALGLSA